MKALELSPCCACFLRCASSTSYAGFVSCGCFLSDALFVSWVVSFVNFIRFPSWSCFKNATRNFRYFKIKHVLPIVNVFSSFERVLHIVRVLQFLHVSQDVWGFEIKSVLWIMNVSRVVNLVIYLYMFCGIHMFLELCVFYKLFE